MHQVCLQDLQGKLQCSRPRDPRFSLPLWVSNKQNKSGNHQQILNRSLDNNYQLLKTVDHLLRRVEHTRLPIQEVSHFSRITRLVSQSKKSGMRKRILRIPSKCSTQASSQWSRTTGPLMLEVAMAVQTACHSQEMICSSTWKATIRRTLWCRAKWSTKKTQSCLHLLN